jgi:hypothetical protein
MKWVSLSHKKHPTGGVLLVQRFDVSNTIMGIPVMLPADMNQILRKRRFSHVASAVTAQEVVNISGGICASDTKFSLA